MAEKNDKIENSDGKFEYVGNKIPLFIKIVWAILVVWLVIYLTLFAFPDLKNWLSM